jgi:hypothetical protein
LSSLRGPYAIEDFSINIGAEVLKDVWLSAAPIEQKILLTDLILQNLCANRNKPTVVRKILPIINKKFFLAPFHLPIVRKQIQNWYQLSSPSL